MRKENKRFILNLCFIAVIFIVAMLIVNDSVVGHTSLETQEPSVSAKTVEDKVEDNKEVAESSFKYYQIPQEYIDAGGYFPEEVQAYLWRQCEERNFNYYVAVALIERESDYNPKASGDRGNSKGYMQVWESWHKERMQAEGAEDLFNPYDNIRVGLNFLQELMSKAESGDYHHMLMCYNMGESEARELNKKGIYSTEYSREILQRAQEIEQGL